MLSCLNLVHPIKLHLPLIICSKLKTKLTNPHVTFKEVGAGHLCPQWNTYFVCACVWAGAVNAPRARLLPLRLGPAELPSGSCWLWHRALSTGQKPGHFWGDAHLPFIISPHPLCLSQYVGLDVSWLCILKGHYSRVFRRVWVNSFMIMHLEWGRGV